MNDEIINLLEKLSSENDNVRHDSFLIISLLVEGALIPGLTRDNEQLLDSFGFEKISLNESEARNVLAKMTKSLSNDTIPLETRVGIVSLLGKFSNIVYIEAIINFLQQCYSILDNQQVYSTLTSINPQYCPSKDLGQITTLIQVVQLTKVLVELRTRNDDRVNEALFDMWGKFKNIGYISEDYPREYTELLLWYITNNYKLLDCEELNSLIESILYVDLAPNNPSLFKTMVEQYNFESILTEIDVRSFDEFHSHLIRECPEELAGVLECYDKDEYDKDHKALKETILEVKKYL